MDDDLQKRPKLIDWRDVVGLTGVALVTCGAGLIYLPAAFIVSGTLLIAGAILLSRRA